MTRAAPKGETPSCANEGCGCPPSTAHHPYCGVYCANVDEHGPSEESVESDSACSCEHVACTASQKVDPAGNETCTSVGRS